MQIPNKTFTDGITNYQKDVFIAFDSGNVRFFALEWARRHRKTTLAVNLLIREACRYPNHKYCYVAPTQVMARNIVWDDPNMLNVYLPDKSDVSWDRNEQKMIVKFSNGSVIYVAGSDKPDSLRGIDANGVVFDEWALIKENTWSEIFRPIMAAPVRPGDPQRWAMFLYTPKGINHATLMLDEACCLGSGGTLPETGKADKMKGNWFASRIDAEKIGVMSSEELSLAKADMPPAMYDQELRCSRVTQEERTFITSLMLNELTKVDWEFTRQTFRQNKRIVSIDPAFGGDFCVIMGIEDGRIIAKEKYHPHKTGEIVFAGKRVAQEIGTKNFIVDCIGFKGVYDALDDDAAGYNVQMFKSSHGSENDLYANKRAEAYAYTSEQIKKLLVEQIEDKELLRQLPVAAMYRVTASGKAIVVLKDKIKEILGCSPDDSDTYVMGIYGLQNVEPEFEGDSNRLGCVTIPSIIGASHAY